MSIYYFFVEAVPMKSNPESEYLDEPDSLEAYDIALEYGVGAVFYTWSGDAED